MDSDPDITQLLAQVRGGDRDAMDRIFQVVYQDLRSIAHRQLLAGGPSQTLNTTALVHESYLKLAQGAPISPDDRSHFLATASRAMRQISIDYARRSQAAKRGGPIKPLSIDDTGAFLESPEIRIAECADEIVALDEALTRLSRLDPRMGQIVELRFFGGLEIDEVSDVIDASPRTVKRLWRTARAFLYQELQGER